MADIEKVKMNKSGSHVRNYKKTGGNHMEHNYELVKDIWQNAEMSKDIIGKLIKICDDSNFRASLAEEFAQYHEVAAEAKTIIEDKGYPVRPKRSAKTAVMSGISVNTWFDKTSTHLAEMMVQGSIMGVIDMKRALKDYPGAEDRTKKLANKLLDTEMNNVKKCLEYV